MAKVLPQQPEQQPPIVKVKTISATYERKINLEHYGGKPYAFESQAVAQTAWADLEEPCTPAEAQAAQDELYAFCKAQVKQGLGDIVLEIQRNKPLPLPYLAVEAVITETLRKYGIEEDVLEQAVDEWMQMCKQAAANMAG